ncbi:unnamed protein product [Cuscuta epithymum]|uniref:Uncharacterized protein n=1 Tax=Cuscuta epithymum TaxID=186058 RepID=A0AAV0EAC7_9ASTE|nr:unnamed protein product [Cuscuta epithymum]
MDLNFVSFSALLEVPSRRAVISSVEHCSVKFGDRCRGFLSFR